MLEPIVYKSRNSIMSVADLFYTIFHSLIPQDYIINAELGGSHIDRFISSYKHVYEYASQHVSLHAVSTDVIDTVLIT